MPSGKSTEYQRQLRELQSTQRQLRLKELNDLNDQAQELGNHAAKLAKANEKYGGRPIPGQLTSFQEQQRIFEEAADNARADLARKADAQRAADELIADRQAAYRVIDGHGRRLEDLDAQTHRINEGIERARQNHEDLVARRNARDAYDNWRG